VPADGFYEWKKEGGRKIPMRVTLKTGEPFAFAGLWNTWKKHDGDVLLTFAIVTTTANELIEPIHSRMPVILDREGEEIWASGETLDVSRVCPLLKPYPSDELKIWRVSPLVNSSRIDSPECLKPC
jgi:putative SOS response-associated peptidase YedK